MASCPSDDTFTEFVEGRLEGNALKSFYDHAISCQACATTLAALSRSTAPALMPSRKPEEAEEPGGDASGLLQEWVVRPPVVGRYRPISVLGAGGMGIVYLALDTQLNRNVALKITRSGVSEAGARRMLREAQAMAKLSHRNVVTVHDAGMWNEHVFVAMEYLEGGTLARHLLEKPRSWNDVLQKFLQAGEGLAAAHRARIVHRDFKPENVLLTAEGEARVADFGLARLLSEEGLDTTGAVQGKNSQPEPADALRVRLTRFGTLLGTPAYMAPEQTKGLPAHHRADIWSFCASLYEALYCELPFPGRTPREVLRHVELGSIRRTPLGSTVPSWVRSALLRGLQADPAARYRNMDTLLLALTTPRVARSRWRYPLVFGITIAAGGALVGIYAAIRRIEDPSNQTSGGAPAASSGRAECATHASSASTTALSRGLDAEPIPASDASGTPVHPDLDASVTERPSEGARAAAVPTRYRTIRSDDPMQVTAPGPSVPVEPSHGHDAVAVPTPLSRHGVPIIRD